jgi:hypothetical protein
MEIHITINNSTVTINSTEPKKEKSLYITVNDLLSTTSITEKRNQLSFSEKEKQAECFLKGLIYISELLHHKCPSDQAKEESKVSQS